MSKIIQQLYNKIEWSVFLLHSKTHLLAYMQGCLFRRLLIE
uniref:Uncharacterized protein n=1 Tax=Tectiviridae sp. cthzn51 TaxID=2826821 RepID=A0A8S5LUT7_9VIRU|nr:MAG TPA: hypothetical protein [Tectiviridae sp. cthzn51]